jgi:cobalt/nickel transport system permease protein
MTQRAWLCAWLLAVVAATLVHTPGWLGSALGVVLLASGSGRGALASRAFRGVLPVLLVISIGYLVMGWLTQGIAWGFLLLLNLRVLLLALLTAWMVRDVDLDEALHGLPGAQRWVSVVRGQLEVLNRLASEYRAAVLSRSTVSPTLRQRYCAGAALGLAALDKAVYNAEALGQGMRSRGAFDE